MDDVDLCVDFARVGDETCFGCDRDLFGDRRDFEHDGDLLRVARRYANGRAMSHEAVAFDVELVVAGRDLFEREATFGVGGGCGDHSAIER